MIVLVRPLPRRAPAVTRVTFDDLVLVALLALIAFGWLVSELSSGP